MAQRILAVNGPNAWPGCGPRAGLTKANGGTASAAPAAAASTSRSTTRSAPKATTTTTTKKATTTPKATKPAKAAPTVSGKSVTVKAGDTRSELAQALRVKGGWQALYQANTSIVKNPNLIYVGGQVLSIPA